uniref:Replication protein A 70 kDa DNA-binding subunit B/D first OB fold domain-containing protein n=1 Tax=Brassica campestris TaxID=3711 RepID=M4EE26_BRACM
MSLSIFPVPQTDVSGVRHSTFTSLRLGRSSQSIVSNILASYSVIHGFIPTRRANHYIPSLKVGFIVKVDRFEVARCSSMYKITNHSFLIHFISPTIIDEVITDAPKINLQSKLDCSTISK